MFEPNVIDESSTLLIWVSNPVPHAPESHSLTIEPAKHCKRSSVNIRDI